MKKDKFLSALVLTSCLLSITVGTTGQALAAYTMEQQAEVTLWSNYISDYANDAFGYLNRANISFDAQEYAKAIEDYDSALKIDQYNTDAYIRRANAKYYLNNFEGALKDYAVALEINSSLPEARFNAGRVFYKVQDYKNAVENMRLGVKLAPDIPEYRFELARAEYKAGLYEEAFDDFAQAIDLKENYLDAYYGNGLAAMNLGKYDVAISCFDRLIQSGMKYENVNYYKAIAEYQLGRYNDALVDFNEALKDNSDDALVYNLRGKTNELLGNKSAAKKDYKTAKKLGLTTVGFTAEEKTAIKAQQAVAQAKKKKADLAATEQSPVAEAFENATAQDAVSQEGAEQESIASDLVEETPVSEEQVVENIINTEETVENSDVIVEQSSEDVVENSEDIVEQSDENVAQKWEEPPLKPEEKVILDEAVNRRLAAENIAAGDIYSAVAFYDNVVSVNPSNSVNYTERAELKLRVDDYDGALKDSEMALRAGTSSPAEALFIQGCAYERKGNYPMAYRAYALALREAPETPQYKYAFGKTAFEVGRFAEAEEVLTSLLESDAADYPQAYLERGKVRYQSGEFYSSIADLTKFIDLNKKSKLEALKDMFVKDDTVAEAYSYRGLNKAALKNNEEAVKDFDLAVKYDKDNVNYYLYRSATNKVLGNYSKVASDYRKIVDIKKDKATTADHLRVAQAAILSENYDEAMIFLDLIVQRDKLNDAVYVDRARLYEKLGKHYLAIGDYTTALNLNPSLNFIYKERGKTYVNMNSYRKGIADLDVAIKYEPENRELYYLRGCAKQAYGDKEGAKADLETARKMENL